MQRVTEPPAPAHEAVGAADARRGEGPADVLEAVIVGTGFSGLGAAIRLKQQGGRSFVILERADEVGGTWRENHYPGCACDVPSHLYSFSFEPNPRWSRMFAPQREILEYLKHCADKYGLRPHIRFRSEVVRADFDEASGTWRTETASGAVYRARYVFLGIGALSRPARPDLPGLARFTGRTFHSAEWDHGYPLAGKRVAVIGTGASAIQIVPQIAPVVGRLALYQRTPPWIVPKPDRAISAREQELLRAVPLLQRLHRSWIYWMMELRGIGFTVDPRIMRGVEALGRYFIRRQIADPVLRAKVTPTYTAGCKRILIANDYYPALTRPNVEVITDPIREVTERGITTADGTVRELDAILFATGFRVSDLLTPLVIRGRGGVELNAAWRQGASAYLGTTMAGFPNLFMLMGPNTGLGHSSMIFMIEAQIDHALRAIRAVEDRGAHFADVRPDAQSAFNDRLQRRLRRGVWASGCKSWYLDEHGNNRTLWPGFTFEFWLRTRRLHAADYVFSAAPTP